MLEKWKVLAQQASTEQNPDRLVAIVKEINLLLNAGNNCTSLTQDSSRKPNSTAAEQLLAAQKC
jgi:hypothetical protein